MNRLKALSARGHGVLRVSKRMAGRARDRGRAAGVACAIFLHATLLVAQSQTGPDGAQLYSESVLATGPEAASDSPYIYHRWNRNEGLPANSVRSVLQTKDGYLWLGTLGGVARFDGLRFQVFDMATAPGLVSNRAEILHEDREGNLWIGHDLQGLTVYRDGEFTSYTAKDGLPPHPVRAIEHGADGLWIATLGGLARLRDDAVEVYTTDDGLPSDEVTSLLQSSDGRLWVGTMRGLARWTGSPGLGFESVPEFPTVPTLGLAENDQGLWVHSDRELFSTSDGSEFHRNRLPSKLEEAVPNFEIRNLFHDRGGYLWLSLYSQTSGETSSLFRFPPVASSENRPDNSAREFDFDRGLRLNHGAPAVYEDREGNIWLGSRGLFRLRPRSVARFNPSHGLPIHSRTITSAPGGGLFIGTSCPSPMAYWNKVEGEVEIWSKARDGSPFDCALGLLREDKVLWIGGDGVLVRQEGDRVERYRIFPGGTGGVLLSIVRDRDGSLWLGTYNRGLVRWEDGEWQGFTTEDGLVSDQVRFLTQARDGSLWIGTSRGLSRFEGGEFENLTEEHGLPGGVVRAIHEDEDSVLWIGTYGGGLARLKEGRFTRYTTADGLFENVVSRILEDGRGRLWMLGNSGLSYARRNELNDFAEGRSSSINTISLEASDGMIEGNGGAQPAGWRTDDGRMWWPTIDGIAVVDADQFRANEVPALTSIERLVVNGEEQAFTPEIRIPPGARDLEVHYAGLSLSDSHKVRFRYRLEGFEDGWVEAGARRTAYYTNLPPGDYRFQVHASNNDGLWPAGGATMGLAVIPRFHERSFFPPLVTLLALGLGYGVFQVNLRRVRARNLRLEREIQERKKAEAAARESEASLSALIENTNHYMWSIDSNYRLTTLNRAIRGAFKELHGRELRVGDDIRVALPEQRAELIAALHVPALAGHHHVEQLPVPAPEGDRELEVFVNPIRDPSGAVIGVSGFAQDVTERKRAEVAIRDANLDLERRVKERTVALESANEELESFAYCVSHDLRAPLRAINGFSQMLLDHSANALDEEGKRRLGRVRAASRRMGELIDDLLDLSRVGRREMRRERVDLSLLAGQVIEDLTRAEPEREATVEIEPELSVEGDESLLRIALENLLGNAWKFTSAVGTSRIIVGRGGGSEEQEAQNKGEVSFFVRDNGAGFDMSYADKLFHPFQRLHGDEFEGTGIGLTTVHRIISRHRGSIWAEAEPGKGATFYFTLGDGDSQERESNA